MPAIPRGEVSDEQLQAIAEYLAERRKMMQQWADMLTAWEKGAAIIPLSQKSA